LTVGDYLNIGLPGDRITSSTILTITGPAPSTYRFTLPVSVGTYGPLTSGTYSDRLNGSGASVSGCIYHPALSGLTTPAADKRTVCKS
jgi:hypothetical protein